MFLQQQRLCDSVTSGSVVHVLRLFPGKEYVQVQCRTSKIMGAVEGMSLILSFSDLSAFIGVCLGTCAFGLFYALVFFVLSWRAVFA